MQQTVPIDSAAFLHRSTTLRAQAADQAVATLSHHGGGLPHTLDLHVGHETFTLLTSDVLRDTGDRFTHNIVKRNELATVTIDPDHAPAAALAVALLRQQPPAQLTVPELVHVIQTLSYLSAWTTVEALSASVSVASLSAASVVRLLAASVEFTLESGLVSMLAAALDAVQLSDADVELFWDLLTPVATPALCAQMTARVGGESRWLWRALASLVCDGACRAEEGGDAAAPPSASSISFARHLALFVQRSKSWCRCTKELVLGGHAQMVPSALLTAAPREALLVKASDGAAVIAMKLPVLRPHHAGRSISSTWLPRRRGGQACEFRLVAVLTQHERQDLVGMFLEARARSLSLKVTVAMLPMAEAGRLCRRFAALSDALGGVAQGTVSTCRTKTFTKDTDSIGCELVRLSEMAKYCNGDRSLCIVCAEIVLRQQA